MNSIGFILTLICVLVVFLAPRRLAIFGIIAGVCYITQWQQIMLGGFHFTAIRIILLFGFVRSLIQGELQSIRINNIDVTLIAFAIVFNAAPAMRTGIWQEPVGDTYNILLSYFVFRCLITNTDDLLEMLPGLACLILPLALCMAYESRGGYNVFNIMGGEGGEWVREGRYRCIGSFRGPHTAGVFGATLIPMFTALFFISPEKRFFAVVGTVSAVMITYTSNSSGPLMAFVCSLLGLAVWPMRERMSAVRKGIVVGILLLDISMKAPIWYVFSKLSDLIGGDGWYRSYLMDQCWRHIADWWLWGTNDTSDWGATLMSWGGADLCNLYVSCAAGAGLGGLVLIILLLVKCFGALGRALQTVRGYDRESEIILWSLGATLFAHVVTVFSVTYWDQMHVPWWGLFGIISSITSSAQTQSSAEEEWVGQPADCPTPVADTAAASNWAVDHSN